MFKYFCHCLKVRSSASGISAANAEIKEFFFFNNNQAESVNLIISPFDAVNPHADKHIVIVHNIIQR